MLHELSHIVHGPHNDDFHALWKQLRDEHQALLQKGYTGEGFLSDGHRLGGRRIPMQEARRLARAAAEKRKSLNAGSGQRLGGSLPQPGSDIRRVIVDAIERRNKIEQGCGNTKVSEKEIRNISDTATRNGFKTQAEEDVANDAAIAQALWELVQEDERAKYGDSYVPPSQANPQGSGGGMVIHGKEAGPSNPPPVPIATRPALPAGPSREGVKGWSCEICTLDNPASYLCCDACGTERPESATHKMASQSQSAAKATRTASDMSKNSSSSRTRTYVTAPPVATQPVVQSWQCSFCGMMMDRQWWTCSTCGKMKDSSR
jgi:DNA-dependent metalloprotease WSS1